MSNTYGKNRSRDKTISKYSFRMINLVPCLILNYKIATYFITIKQVQLLKVSN